MPKSASKAKNIKFKEIITKQQKFSEHPRSYRFDAEILATLSMVLDRVNQVSPKKITETRLMKALIHLSADIDEDTLIKAIKEVW